LQNCTEINSLSSVEPALGIYRATTITKQNIYVKSTCSTFYLYVHIVSFDEAVKMFACNI